MGLRGDLLGGASGPVLAFVSDALWSRTASDRAAASGDATSLAASSSDTSRLRLGLEGSWALPLGLTPSWRRACAATPATPAPVSAWNSAAA